MTLDELDNALVKSNLDLNSDIGTAIRNKILTLYGTSILESKKFRCSNCWFKSNNRCNNNCELYDISQNPIEVAISFINSNNDINIIPFLYMYAIPVYEELTGDTEISNRIFRDVMKVKNAKK